MHSEESTPIAGFGGGERRPWAKHCGQPLQAGKVKEMDSPLELQKGMQPGHHPGILSNEIHIRLLT